MRALITITDLREIEVGATAPASPAPDTIWIDTSVTPNVEKRWAWNESTQTGQWVIVNDVSQNTTVTQLVSNLSVADGKISSIVSELWTNGDMTSESRVEQNSDKISWAVEDVGSGSQSQMQLTSDAMSFIGNNIDITLNNDFNLAAEKINWVAQKDGQTSAITLTPDAMGYIGDNVNISANDSVNVVVGSISQEISAVANSAQEALEAAEGVATSLSVTQEELSAQIASQGEVLSVMTLDDNGLSVRTGDSPYSTLTDGNGFHVLQEDSEIASFTNDGLQTDSITIGNIVCRKTSKGGWAWNTVA